MPRQTGGISTVVAASHKEQHAGTAQRAFFCGKHGMQRAQGFAGGIFHQHIRRHSPLQSRRIPLRHFRRRGHGYKHFNPPGKACAFPFKHHHGPGDFPFMRQRKVRALYSQKLRPAGSRSVKMQLRPSGRQTENLHILRSDSFRKSGSQSLDSRLLGRKTPATKAVRAAGASAEVPFPPRSVSVDRTARRNAQDISRFGKERPYPYPARRSCSCSEMSLLRSAPIVREALPEERSRMNTPAPGLR